MTGSFEGTEMNVVIEEAGTCRKKLKIEWPAERVDQDYQATLAQYAKLAKIKGFRPGKAPVKIVEKQYSKDILGDVKDRLIPEGYQAAIKEHGLNVVQVLDLEEPTVAANQPMIFSITVEVAPEFDLPEYKDIKLTRESVEPADEQVDEAIANIAEQFASFDEVEGRPVQKGDLVQIDYEGICEGTPIDDVAEETKGLGKREDFWVRADENAFLPEFEDGLVGLSIGEKRDIQVDFADDFGAKPLAGKKATYFVTVKGIRERKVPDLDESFYQRLGVKDEAELRDRIREDLEQSASQRETQRLRNDVIDALIKDLDIDLPQTAVSRETQQIIQSVIRDNSQRGVSESKLMEQKDEILSMANRNAESRVKAQFVLDRVAEKENIAVSKHQFEEHLNRLAAGYGMKPKALREELKRRDALDEVEAELRRSQTVDFLLEQADIAEAKKS